jgi:hypothetical protein
LVDNPGLKQPWALGRNRFAVEILSLVDNPGLKQPWALGRNHFAVMSRLSI